MTPAYFPDKTKSEESSLTLRPFCDADIALMQRWLYTPHVAKWYTYPEHWLLELRQRHGTFSFLTHFIAEAGDVPFGFCQYYDTFFATEHEVWNDDPDVGKTQGDIYSIDYLIGEAEYLQRGFGKEMITQMLALLQKTGAKTVIAQPEPGNIASKRALEASGFIWNGKSYRYSIHHKGR